MTTATTTDRLESLYDYLTMSDDEREADLCEMGYNRDMEGEEMEFDAAVEYWHGEDSAMLPAWAHMTVVGREDEQTLCHITDRETAEKILVNGFIGIEDVRRVATSTAFRDRAYSAEGFSYAYRLADVDAGTVDNPGWYGDTILVFEAPSLRVKSSFDGEEQSIFVAGTAKNIRIAE